jgi:glycosyltransferase involved in cell wall biosynthesis
VDGGSEDGSVEIIKNYDSLYRTRQHGFGCKSFEFLWWTGKDKGQSHALNQGFAKSSGAILGWLNSDDTFFNSKSLGAVHEAFVEKGADIVAGNAHLITQNDQIVNTPCLLNSLDNRAFQNRLKGLFRNNFIIQPSCLFKRSVWERYKIDEHYHYVMDWVFWLNAYLGGYRFHKIDNYIAASRIHEGAKTVAGGMTKYHEALSIFREYDVSCFNRIYYLVYLVLLEMRRFPTLHQIIAPIEGSGKKIRNLLINRLKLY